MKKSQKNSQKIVIKVGSSVLTGGTQSLNRNNLRQIVRHVTDFIKKGNDVILVSSGAIACALSLLGFKKRPSGVSQLQAVAATGQNILMHEYRISFKEAGFECAQILLTREDLGDKARYLNAKNTLDTLIKLKVVPVVNENDAISVDEIKFGDNDVLSALVAAATGADGLLLLTDIEGLYKDYNIKTKTRGEIIKEVENITSEIERFACGTDKVECVGGMSSKIEAARIATNMGIPVILANGLKDSLNIDFKVKDYTGFDGTRFLAAKSIGERKHWIAFSAISKGKILVDDGARSALVIKGKSLLSPGVVDILGSFETGDVVEVCDSGKNVFAKGKVGCSSSELAQNKGKRINKEVIHCDNLVILG